MAFGNRTTFGSSGTTGFGSGTGSSNVDIIDSMDSYLPLLTPSKQKEYLAIKEGKDKPSWFQKAVSFLSAGETGDAVYNMLDGKNPVASYGKDVLNGIQGLGYDKKTYADVLEKLGMDRGALSEVMPWLYNETGKGIQFKKGGFLDPTARGTLGLALDVLGDPTTYIGGAGLLKRGYTGALEGLSKEGKLAVEAIQDSYKPIMEGTVDALEKTKLAEKMAGEIASKVKSEPDKYFSGLKMFGQEIVNRKTVLGPGRFAEKTMQHIPIINGVYRGAKEGVQDVFKYGADILRKGKDLGQAGLETAQKYLDIKKSLSRQSDWEFEKLYKSLSDTKKDFENAVTKGDRETARQYILDKIETSFGSLGIKGLDNTTIDNILNKVTKFQKDIASGQLGSREGLQKDLFDEIQGYLPHIMTPEAKEALAKLNVAKFKGGSVSDYALKQDKGRVLWNFISDTGDKIKGNAEKLGLQPYSKMAEQKFLYNHFSKLIRTQEKNLDKITSMVNKNERKKLAEYVKYADSTAFDPKELENKIGWLDQLSQKYIGKGNEFSLKIDEIKKDLQKNLDDLPDADKYFIDKDKKVWTKDRSMSINEINQSEDIQRLMKESGFEGKNFFETDPFAITLSRGQGAIREIERNKLLKDLVDNFGIQGDASKVFKRSDARRTTSIDVKYNDKYVDGVRYIDPEIKELPEGTLLPDLIVEDLKKVRKALDDDNVINKVLKTYDKVINVWKSSVYGFFPASHGRNYIGGAFMNFMANPKWSKYIGDVEKVRKGVDTVVDLGDKSIYKDYTAQQWKEEVAKRGLFSQTGSLDINDINKALNKSNWEKVQNIPMKAGEMVEQNLRLPLFLAEISDGKTIDEAMNTVYRYHFDYAPRAATEAERMVLKRLIPFYTWTKNAIPLMVEQLIETPGKMTSFYKAIRNADDGSGEVDRTLLPSYLEEDPAIMSGGSTLSGLGLPPLQLLQFFGGDKGIGGNVIDSVTGMLTPALKIPIEVRTNFNTFKDKQITEDKSGNFAENFSQPVKDWLEYQEKDVKTKDGKTIKMSTVNPMRKYWLYALPTGRLSGIISRSLGESEQNKLGYIMTGISEQKYDLEQLKATKEKEYEEKLKEIMTDAGIFSEYGTAYKSSKTQLKELDNKKDQGY